MRPNDTSKGRAIKLTHYIDLHQRFMGTPPSDIPLLVRTIADVPLTMKNEVMKQLQESGWTEQPIPDPTLLSSQVRKSKGGR
jgi:acetyl-CoA decarbonylase/synthase complex subunit alpha